MSDHLRRAKWDLDESGAADHRPSRDEITPPTDAEVAAALLGPSPMMEAFLDGIAGRARRSPSDDAQKAA